MKRRLQDKMAELAGMSVAEFFHSTAGPRLIPIVGYVAGGEKFTPVDDADPREGIDHIKLDIGDDDQIAVRVRGQSMAPVYRDGDVVIGAKVSGKSLASAIGRDCIVKTIEGEGYLKILQKGSAPGTFRLRSYNSAYDDIDPVRIEWVAPVLWVGRSV